jgi:hypothetical protein
MGRFKRKIRQRYVVVTAQHKCGKLEEKLVWVS